MEAFNTLEYFENLKNAGLKEEESKAIVHVIEDVVKKSELATKADLIILKIELQAFIVKSVLTSVIILSGLQTLFHFLR